MLFNDNYTYFIDLVGISQKEISEKTGIAESTLSRLRTTESIPRPSTLRKLSHVFSQKSGIPYSEFDEGRALLTKDFRKYDLNSREQKLQVNETESPHGANASTETPGIQPPRGVDEQFLSTLHQAARFYRLTPTQYASALTILVKIFEITGGNPINLDAVHTIWQCARGDIKDNGGANDKGKSNEGRG